MKRVDLLSLIFGVVFGGFAMLFLGTRAANAVTALGRVGPAALIVIGVLVFAENGRRKRR